MSKKLRKILNNKMFVFILGGLLFSVASVYAITYFPSNQVTYDNSTSKLNSNNVQGAIDELYNECSSSVSSRKYMYYTVTQYRSGNPIPNGGQLYRCNVDGSNCTTIEATGSNSYKYFNSVAASNDYMYYAVIQYSSSEYIPNSGQLYRCNVDGNNCTTIEVTGINTYKYISSVVVINDYMYYTVTQYNPSVLVPGGGSLYRCNIDGSNCTTIKSTGSNSYTYINSVG